MERVKFTMRSACSGLVLFGLLLAVQAVRIKEIEDTEHSREHYDAFECSGTYARFEEACYGGVSRSCCEAYDAYAECFQDEYGYNLDDYTSLDSECEQQGFTGGGNECFSANSWVLLEDGSVKSMQELAIGDRVQTGKDTFSEVFSWGHRDPAASASFRRIYAGERHIEVTGSHYLLVNNKLVAAAAITTGDLLKLGDGGEAEVIRIETVNVKGLYNPHTLDGQIVVNGLTASIYTRAVPPVLAHFLLAAPRLLYRLGLGDVLGSYLHGATPNISRMIPRGSVSYN